ncbi:MAG TPA: S8 family serine peptidase, partial [Pyrinomonadaceae bacterium]|nr:S8 family serine peptidase [Pyrinomonadaceae bacterium]
SVLAPSKTRPKKDQSNKEAPQIWQVSLNRKALPAVDRSVPAVKGDAARTLFSVKCDKITWAVLDSGIDGSHPAFNGSSGSRVVKAFDFSNIREIVSLDNEQTNTAAFKKRVEALISAPLRNELTAKTATDSLKALADDAANDRPIHWELVEKFIEIQPTTPPVGGHGTHVAGIIGSSAGQQSGFADGMCPDINLYDFRVLAKTLADTEFAIIAALQYLRYLNERHTYLTIHGANLSLSIPHDVRNFACGRTPICNECERLVESGVVIVAAAGNLGYQRFETKYGSYEGYTAFSITDPGNADGVITVGATHRFRPHTYGVSFFSSRGPTGDGRLKPDLVAPGERIESSLPGGEWGELDGTSMAAP